jgi:hypothetical protein
VWEGGGWLWLWLWLRLNYAPALERKIPLFKSSIFNGYVGKLIGEGCSFALEACLKTIQKIIFVFVYTHPKFYAFLVLTPLAIFCALSFGSTPFGWLHSITLTPYL